MRPSTIVPVATTSPSGPSTIAGAQGSPLSGRTRSSLFWPFRSSAASCRRSSLMSPARGAPLDDPRGNLQRRGPDRSAISSWTVRRPVARGAKDPRERLPNHEKGPACEPGPFLRSIRWIGRSVQLPELRACAAGVVELARSPGIQEDHGADEARGDRVDEQYGTPPMLAPSSSLPELRLSPCAIRNRFIVGNPIFRTRMPRFPASWDPAAVDPANQDRGRTMTVLNPFFGKELQDLMPWSAVAALRRRTAGLHLSPWSSTEATRERSCGDAVVRLTRSAGRPPPAPAFAVPPPGARMVPTLLVPPCRGERPPLVLGLHVSPAVGYPALNAIGRGQTRTWLGNGPTPVPRLLNPGRAEELCVRRESRCRSR